MWRLLRKYFLAGLFVLLPLVVTVYVLVFSFNLVDGIFKELVRVVVGRHVPGAGFLLTVCLVFLTGVLATNVGGRRLLAWGESLLLRLPLVRTVYTTSKQVVEAFSLSGREGFQRVVLVEYPRRGLYSIGFVTGKAPAEVSARAERPLLSVFVPTTPNPTSGYLLLVPREEVVFLEMSVEDGLKLVISGGLVTPDAGS